MYAKTHRMGFSLIEMLTVISIMAVLSAMSAGVYFRLRAAQTDKANEAVVTRLSTFMNRVTQAVRDDVAYQARTNNLNPDVLFLSRKLVGGSVSDEDRDLARTMATYLKMKSEFPQYFDEAAAINVNTGLQGVPLVRPPVAALPASPSTLHARKAAYLQTATNAPTTSSPLNVVLMQTPPAKSPVGEGRDYALEAAALLYTVLTERGNRGELFGDDAVGASVADVTTDYRLSSDAPGTRKGSIKVKVFKDMLGTPITFVRFATSLDIQANANAGVLSQDQLDPQGRIIPWLSGANAVNTNYQYTMTALRYDTPWIQASPNVNVSNAYYLGAGTAPQRWVTTVVSAGNARNWDAMNVAMYNAITASPSLLINVPMDAGYIYSYETRK